MFGMSFGNSSTVTINGKTYKGNGSITVKGNKVYIDGKLQNDQDSKTINIVVNGDVEKIEGDCDKIEVTGNVTGNISTQSGDIKCGDIQGSVSTMSGDVKCKSIGGSVSTMSGDIDKRLL